MTSDHDAMGPVGATVASRFTQRMRGLLFSSAEHWRGRWLILVPCNSVHTLGMRFSIDIAFVDSDGRVLMSRENVLPGLVRIACRRAVITLERPHGGGGERWPQEGDSICLDVVSRCADDDAGKGGTG